MFELPCKKSRIRETKHLSTDADSSTDAIGGWTKAKSAKKKKYLGFKYVKRLFLLGSKVDFEPNNNICYNYLEANMACTNS